jgi:hypothetical protein
MLRSQNICIRRWLRGRTPQYQYPTHRIRRNPIKPHIILLHPLLKREERRQKRESGKVFLGSVQTLISDRGEAPIIRDTSWALTQNSDHSRIKREERREKRESGIVFLLFSFFYLLSYLRFPTNPIASNRERVREKKEDRRENPDFSFFSPLSSILPRLCFLQHRSHNRHNFLGFV